MPYLLGTDEAGYGPNLGPLVVSATAWFVPEDPRSVDLYERLAAAVSPEAVDDRLAVADSKQLYKSGDSLRLLERGVLAALSQLGEAPTAWRDVFARLLAGDLSPAADHDIPWHARYCCPLPIGAMGEEIASGAALLREALAACGVRLVAMRSAVIQAARFNKLVAEEGNKGSALSRVTLSLLAGILRELPAEPALVVCDKHGGRNHYAGLLQQFVTEEFVEVRHEGREESAYAFGPRETRVEIRFRAGGESFLPAALASMTSKYLRELSMRAFNAFWCEQVPGLRPTAGYPGDARRFKTEITAAQAALGIEDGVLWRER